MDEQCALCARRGPIPKHQQIVVLYRALRLCGACWLSFMDWLQASRVISRETRAGLGGGCVEGRKGGQED